MRIALVAMSCDDSTGIGRIVCTLARMFSESGHEVTVVAQRVEHLPAGVAGVRFSPIPLSTGLSRLAFNYQTRRLFHRSRFEIVNAFGVGRGASVVSAQSCHAAGVELQKVARRGRLASRGFGLFDAVALLDERILMTSPETQLVIGSSMLVRNQLLQYYGLPADKVTVIPNGADVDRLAVRPDPGTRAFERKQAGFDASDFVLLFIGNEFDRKGLQTIIEAMSKARDTKIKLAVIGGDDPDAYKMKAGKLGVGEQVRFLGRMHGPDRYLHLADALVHPAWYEPFGMVIVEAMAAGLPVVASGSAGALEGLTHGTHALFLEDPRDADELAVALKRLRDDATLRQSMTLRGSEAAQRFSWEKITTLTLAAYAGVTGEQVGSA